MSFLPAAQRPSRYEYGMNDDRAYWVSKAEMLARPVLEAASARQLKAKMPVEAAPGINDRAECTHLEALARVLMGLAPWLELGADGSDEGHLRAHFASQAREAIDAATNSASPDLLAFAAPHQALVDAAFLAQAILRAPNELWHKLPQRAQGNLAACLAQSRIIKPAQCNWLLFSATVEAALAKMGQPWDAMRVDYSVRKHADWYLGDGLYGDGAQFHWDYYNSFVIQPMLVDVLAAVGEYGEFGISSETALHRARRWASILERLISPEGTLPPLGRSLTYRFGALQTLAQMALLHQLDDALHPAQVRCAMTAFLRRVLEAPGTFDARGWLRIGFCGAQPALGEPYISTGSLYLCAAGFLPLGLSAADPFWSNPPALWTAQQIYSGANLPADHAV